MRSPALRWAKPFNLLSPPPASSVLWFPGQDDAYSATIRDRSGSGNHGTLTGTTWTRNAKGLWVTLHDGNDSIDCGTLFNSAATLWMNFWFATTSNYAANGTSLRLLAKRLDANNITEFYLSSSTGRFTGLHYIGGAVKFSISLGPSSWVAGVWHNAHVSISAANAVRARIDGGTATTDPDTTPLANGGALILGAQQSGTAGGWEGRTALWTFGTTDLTAEQEVGLYTRNRGLFGV